MIFFVIGMRRSGTSILRRCIAAHNPVTRIEFEPHPLWYAVHLSYMKRFKDSWIRAEINRFKAVQGLHGAKFALNSGTDALSWKLLPDTFKGSKYVFIERNEEDVYKSVRREDFKTRGVVSHMEHQMSHLRLNEQFRKFCKTGDGVMISYEGLREDPNKEMDKARKLLGLSYCDIGDMIR